MENAPAPRTNREDPTLVGRWMALWAASLFLLVLIGGATRLTESGLSITEWKPVSGILPPLNAAAWNEAFEKYKQIPQYLDMGHGMTVDDFKGIFLWEYAHRLWARLVGVLFAVPLVLLWRRGAVPRSLRPRLVTLLVLMGLQGLMGWYMVMSGLTERVSVSQYRLAAHLSLALVIYATALWTALDLLAPAAGPEGWRWFERRLRVLTGAAFVVIISGAFVAGLRAGRIYNTFPKMGDRWTPVEYWMLTPAWRNFFENPAAAQFDHRLLAVTLVLVCIATWWEASREAGHSTVGRRLSWVAVAAAVQASLGMMTLVFSVPVALGVAHQAGAVLLFSTLLAAWHATRA
ncbi:MAG: COX15/CtaA family protein [Gemmatimonadetes bacterium]|nr:COX15/CtaA family protein [Gemmatimonadota bacterium]